MFSVFQPSQFQDFSTRQKKWKLSLHKLSLHVSQTDKKQWLPLGGGGMCRTNFFSRWNFFGELQKDFDIAYNKIFKNVIFSRTDDFAALFAVVVRNHAKLQRLWAKNEFLMFRQILPQEILSPQNGKKPKTNTTPAGFEEFIQWTSTDKATYPHLRPCGAHLNFCEHKANDSQVC